jgi:hypothetical protein
MALQQRFHVEVELDESVLADAIRELGLNEPPTFTLNHNGKVSASKNSGGFLEVRGLYSPSKNNVTIATATETAQRERIPELAKHLRFTVLHELRHAWQRENWSGEYAEQMAAGPYFMRGEEIDANEWAEYAMPLFPGLVKVKRRPVGGKTGFQRLGKGA